MKLSQFDFDLPDDLIAVRPAQPRTAARMLLAAGDAPIRDLHVADLPTVLRPGDVLVLNDTRVIPAAIPMTRQRQTGQGKVRAAVDVTLMRALPDGTWRVMARPLRKLVPGDRLETTGGLVAHVVARSAEDAVIAFDADPAGLEAALDRDAAMPLPPYIARRRAADARDRQDYQTVFAARPGAVAAPTASLHFDTALLDRIGAMGVGFARVTLHVGAGTFLPVKVENIDDHVMHAEWGEVGPAAADAINAARAGGGRVIPVGTTALRLIESAASDDGTVAPFAGDTDIFIRPGYAFRVTDGLITNFHLPKSTLLMLVAALVGMDRMRAIYAHAVAHRYRFFSYGDSSLLLP